MAIEISFLAMKRAKTVGWSVNDTVAYLKLDKNEWKDRSYAQRQNLLINLLDPEKFGHSTVWSHEDRNKYPKDDTIYEKSIRVFVKGYTIREQLNTIMEELAGDSTDVVIPYEKVFSWSLSNLSHQGQSYQQLERTILKNLDPKWLTTTEDKNYLTGFTPRNDNDEPVPFLPSTRGKVFRAGFDLDMEVPDEPID